MKFVFRVDASLNIGTGHVMRCLTLADELFRQGHDCCFICREHEGHLGDIIIKRGHQLILLPTAKNGQSSERGADNYKLWLGMTNEQDAIETLKVLSTMKPDWLVIDHYGLDVEWELVIADAVDKIMVIDDLANRSHKCSLLLDQNLGRVNFDYDKFLPASCKRLIGPRYALLRPEFLASREKSIQRRCKPDLRRVLISLGGVDEMNLTSQILETLEDCMLPNYIEFDIIMGAYAPFLDEVRHRASKSSYGTSVSVNVANMAEMMSNADLAIGAAGSTAWERCCLGLPSIQFVLAENQLGIANSLDSSGAALTIENANQVDKMLPSLIQKLSNSSWLKSMAESAADITDGTGTLNVITELNGLNR